MPTNSNDRMFTFSQIAHLEVERRDRSYVAAIPLDAVMARGSIAIDVARDDALRQLHIRLRNDLYEVRWPAGEEGPSSPHVVHFDVPDPSRPPMGPDRTIDAFWVFLGRLAGSWGLRRLSARLVSRARMVPLPVFTIDKEVIVDVRPVTFKFVCPHHWGKPSDCTRFLMSPGSGLSCRDAFMTEVVISTMSKYGDVIIKSLSSAPSAYEVLAHSDIPPMDEVANALVRLARVVKSWQNGWRYE